MALQDYHAGWDFERLGTAPVQFTDSGGSWTMTFTEGSYSHIDLSGVLGTGEYADFITAIQAAITAAARGVVYTTSFNTSTLAYSFDTSSGTLAMSFSGTAGTIMRRILGFTGNVAATSSAITSDARPYYVARALVAGQSNYSDEYESSDGIEEKESDDGDAVSISRYTIPTYLDWEQMLEEKSPPATIASDGTGVFENVATTTVPWTWQHFYRHVRATEPFALYDNGSGEGLVCRMRKDTAKFKPVRAMSEYDVLWNLPFNTRLLGSL